MDNNILKQLLTEYDSKRMYALKTLEDRKEHLREISSKYTSLEKDMQNISLEVLKAMLNSEDTEKEKKLKDLQQKTNEISEKKAKLLQSLNLPADYLTPHFECSLCQDTGYVQNSL